jgi:hypothetical protein
MPIQDIHIPTFASIAKSPAAELEALEAASKFDAQDIQFLLKQEALPLDSLDDAPRQALIGLLEQELQRLEPLLNTRAVTNTVRKIAQANR